MREPLLAGRRLRVHVRDLDAGENAVRRAAAERGARIVGVHVNAQSGLVSDDEQRVAELADRSFERLPIEAVSLDDEGRAVAVLR